MCLPRPPPLPPKPMFYDYLLAKLRKSIRIYCNVYCDKFVIFSHVSA